MTPPWLLDLVRKVGDIILDPCASRDPKFHFAKVNLDGTEGKDGLTQDWNAAAQGGLTFCNPPYGHGHMKRWAPKIAQEAINGTEVIALVRQSMGSAWFQDHIAPNYDALCVLRGRVVFLDPGTGLSTAGGGTFDSVVLYFGRRAAMFRQVFGPHGWLPRP